MTIKPIETTYAGCHFRSRLEARWAVFFDHLGIEWRYEYQGYSQGGSRYLPDFYLPLMWLHVEVKGVMSEADAVKVISLSSSTGPSIDPSILILGDIPKIGANGPHHKEMSKSSKPGYTDSRDVSFFRSAVDDAWILLKPHGWTRWLRNDPYTYQPRDWIVDSGFVIDQQVIATAYTAARSARFEHGESGT